MGAVIKFPARSVLPLVLPRAKGRHKVYVRVVDEEASEEARWHMQFPIQNAASFRALKGFKDAAVRAGLPHVFYVGRVFLLRRFLHQIEALIASGRVVIRVDDIRVRPAERKRKG